MAYRLRWTTRATGKGQEHKTRITHKAKSPLTIQINLFLLHANILFIQVRNHGYTIKETPRGLKPVPALKQCGQVWRKTTFPS